MQHDQLQGNEEAQEKERTQTRLTAPPGSADFGAARLGRKKGRDVQ